MGQLRNFRFIELGNDLFFTSTFVLSLDLIQQHFLFVNDYSKKDKMSLFITNSFSAEHATYITADQFWLRAGFWIIKRKNKLIV